jgi:hypothetical protein
MRYFNTFFFVFRLLHICTKFFFLIAENDICKLFFLGLRIILFHNTAPLQSSGIVDGEIFYSVFLVLYANSENTLKVVYRFWRLRQKYLIVFGEWAKSLLAYMDITTILERFYSEYAKSILPFKRIWRRCQEWFAVYGEYANRHKNELSTKTPYWTCSKGKQAISRYCPFNM